MASITWGRDVAEVYDRLSASRYDPSELEPTVDRLEEWAGGGPALEFAVGTGRVAIPLAQRGVAVHGIELSPHMVEVMRAKPGADQVDVAVGDMTTTRLRRRFTLVYIVFNSLMNVTTQDEQLAVFENAAAHLARGGRFVVELMVPQLRRSPPGEMGWIYELDADHVSVETFDDPVGQIAWSHHWVVVDGHLFRHAAPYRYVWPAELDLMARLAGFCVGERWGDWRRGPFTAESESQVVVFEKE